MENEIYTDIHGNIVEIPAEFSYGKGEAEDEQ